MTTDVLGAPYTAETLTLPDDHEGELVATLVHRPADGGPADRAVLHVHGFSDYFFQTEYAEWWTARGYDFYALDLPKAGRSYRSHQTPHYVTDLDDYFPTLDEAWARVTSGHQRVVVSAHSTGGLTTPLWADARKPAQLVGMFLNSPWLDLQGSAVVRTVGTPLVHAVAKRKPMRAIPRTVSGLYTRSLHKDHEGEWDFDLSLKPIESFTVTTGWLSAIRKGHARVHAGLGIEAPVLVLSSAASGTPSEMNESVHATDIVLEVPQIRRWATAIGTHVTYVAVEGARHDVVLSRPPARKKAYDELGRWLDTYVS